MVHPYRMGQLPKVQDDMRRLKPEWCGIVMNKRGCFYKILKPYNMGHVAGTTSLDAPVVQDIMSAYLNNSLNKELLNDLFNRNKRPYQNQSSAN